ncbi:hypothetical protein D3C75_825190 [compost metagenome]
MSKVITLCGSTKFKKEFEEVNARFTLEGNVVISVGVFGHADGIALTEEQKMKLDLIHFEKIDMADEIFVINVGGYVGNSTSLEIAYAQSKRKPVHYFDPQSKKEAARQWAIEAETERPNW